jgi:hypothetical protein
MAMKTFKPAESSVIIFDTEDLGERPSRAVDAGRVRRISRGIYTKDMTTPLEQLVRTHVWEILAKLVPDALIVDRSAGPILFEGGTLFVVSQVRIRDLELPGLRIVVRAGHPALSDDPLWMGNLHRSSIPRALIENLARSRARKGISRTLSGDEMASWIAQLAQQYPSDRLNRFRDRARDLSELFDQADRFPELDEMIGAALGTHEVRGNGLLVAMSKGEGWDVARLAALTNFADRLASGELALRPLHLPILVPAALAEQAFFESYFSNFIEGTEFTVDEAIKIVYEDDVPSARPADAHDVSSTYFLIKDVEESSTVATNSDQLLDQLQRRHARILALRPEKRPGQFKQEANQFGSYRFVDPEQVRGTLMRGFHLRDRLTSPFQRAAFMMFLISEVHPFDDGNGRLARLAMNSELSASGEHRILLPLILRNDYLNGLRQLSREGDGQLLVRVLTGAWQWSAQVDFSPLATARLWLEKTNALIDAPDAERMGKHLILPADLQ